MIVDVSLQRIIANPWQTRVGDPDPEYIKDLALDIASNGLLQTPAGRLVFRKDGQIVDWDSSTLAERLASENVVVQIAFGHNRLAAYQWLVAWLVDVEPNSDVETDYSFIPVDVQHYTDEQMAQIAWSENEKRRDVTPIERAQAIRRRMDDFGWSQAKIAERLGISRPAVSNALRLLKLPENVQAALSEGRIVERVAMALVSFFDLPESIRQRAEHDFYYGTSRPSDLIQQAIEGNLTSDQIRGSISNYCSHFGRDLKEAVFSLDEVFAIENIQAPACRDCESRFKERNLCLDPACFELKTDEFKRAYLVQAGEAAGFPPLESEREGDSWGYGGKFTNLDDKGKGRLETIVAGKCENLRLRYDKGHGNVPGYPNARIVCGRQEQHCQCLAGLKAAQNSLVSSHYDHGYSNPPERIVEPPLVQQTVEQPTAEDLKDMAREARKEKRQLGAEKRAILHECAERVATGLIQHNLKTWKWLAGHHVHYSLRDSKADNLFDLMVEMVETGEAGVTYPDTLGGVLHNINGILKECDLERIPSWDFEQHIPAAPADLLASEEAKSEGKTLKEVFAEEGAVDA